MLFAVYVVTSLCIYGMFLWCCRPAELLVFLVFSLFPVLCFAIASACCRCVTVFLLLYACFIFLIEYWVMENRDHYVRLCFCRIVDFVDYLLNCDLYFLLEFRLFCMNCMNFMFLDIYGNKYASPRPNRAEVEITNFACPYKLSLRPKQILCDSLV